MQEFEINSSCYVNDKFIGTTVAKKATVKLLDDGNYSLENKDINIKTGIEINNAKEYQKLGTYTIPKPDTEEVSGNTSFTGYDYMKKFDTLYVDSNTYPIRLDSCLENLCSQVGLTLGNKNFPNNSYMLKGNPFTNRETRKTVLSNLVQLTGGFAEIDVEDGKLYVRNLDVSGEAVETIDGNNYDGFKPNNVFGPVNSVRIQMNSGVDGEETIKEAEGVTDENRCQITIADNYYLTSAEEREAVINGIFNALNGLTYLPIELSYYGYPWLKLGDKIKVKDKSDKEYVTYVMEHTLKYNGAYSGTIKAIALTKTQQAYKEAMSLKEWRRNTELAVDKINGKITSITEETTENSQKLTKTEQDVNGLTTKVSSVEQSVENITNTQNIVIGKNIHLEDSSDDPLVSIKVKGSTNQATRSGKNLAILGATSGTIDGVPFTINKGIININGTTPSKNANYYSNSFRVSNSGIATFWIEVTGYIDKPSNNASVLLEESSDNSTWSRTKEISCKSTTQKQYQITLDNSKYYRIRFYTSENTFTNATIKIQLEYGTNKTEFEQYGASPSPDYPSEIENIEGNIEFNVEGKNKLKGLSTPLTDSDYWYNLNKNYFEPLEDGWGKFSYDNSEGTSTVFINAQVKLNAINLKPNTQYTIITEFRNSTVSENAGAFFTVTSGNATDVWQAAKTVGYSYINQGKIVKLTATTKEDFTGVTTGLATYLRLGAGTSGTVEARISVIEGDYDTTDFEYEPYKSQVVTFPLGEGEKLYQGSYLADDGIQHKRKQVVFNGSDDEGWSKDSNQNNSSTDYFYIRNIGINTNNIDSVICNYFKKGSSTVEGFWATTVFCITINKTATGIVESDTKDQRVAKWKTWLSENPITVEYDLAEPEVVPYTAEQQEAWDKIEQLHTYKNVTNIFSDTELDIVYVRDNGLSDMYETKQNASKNYTKTSTEIQQLDDSIKRTISQIGDRSQKTTTVTEDIDGIKNEVSKIQDLTQTTSGTKTIALSNCAKGNLLKLQIKGNNTVFKYLYPSNNLYPANNLLPMGDSRILVNDIQYELGVLDTLRQNGEVYDEFVLENGQAKVIRRINTDGTVKTEEMTEDLGKLSISLNDGTNIIKILNYSAEIIAKYATKNNYTDIFATKVEMSSSIEQTAEGINQVVRKKVDEDEIISKINQSAEEVEIDSNRININGAVSANGNFKVDTERKHEM